MVSAALASSGLRSCALGPRGQDPDRASVRAARQVALAYGGSTHRRHRRCLWREPYSATSPTTSGRSPSGVNVTAANRRDERRDLEGSRLAAPRPHPIANAAVARKQRGATTARRRRHHLTRDLARELSPLSAFNRCPGDALCGHRCSRATACRLASRNTISPTRRRGSESLVPEARAFYRPHAHTVADHPRRPGEAYFLLIATAVGARPPAVITVDGGLSTRTFSVKVPARIPTGSHRQIAMMPRRFRRPQASVWLANKRWHSGSSACGAMAAMWRSFRCRSSRRGSSHPPVGGCVP